MVIAFIKKKEANVYYFNRKIKRIEILQIYDIDFYLKI